MEDKKKSNIICWISIASLVAGFLLGGLGTFVTNYRISNFFDSLPLIGIIAAFSLMIAARVVCKSNVFAKVLMWVYIVLLILAILFFAFVMIALAYLCSSAFNSNDVNSLCESCYECGQIGIFFVASFINFL